MVVVTGVEMTIGYIRWYYTIFHPYIIPLSENIQAPRPPEKETLDKVACKHQGRLHQLDMNIFLGIVGGGEVERGDSALPSLEC